MEHGINKSFMRERATHNIAQGLYSPLRRLSDTNTLHLFVTLSQETEHMRPLPQGLAFVLKKTAF